MTSSHIESWGILIENLAAKAGIVKGWNNILDFHSELFQSTGLDILRNLPVLDEQIGIRNWIDKLLLESPIPTSILAIWFGLFTMNDTEGQRPVLYIHGSQLDPNDNGDWACQVDYQPLHRYVAPKVLLVVDSIVSKEQKNGSFLDWILPLSYCVLTLDEVVRARNDKILKTESTRSLHVAVGFDDGDFMEITPLLS